jgi:hypothetical protein
MRKPWEIAVFFYVESQHWFGEANMYTATFPACEGLGGVSFSLLFLSHPSVVLVDLQVANIPKLPVLKTPWQASMLGLGF